MSEVWRPSHVEPHLAGGAGQSHPSLQLRQDLLLQAVQLVSSGSASFGHPVQLVATSVHQVVVDGEQCLVMDLRKQTSTLTLDSLDTDGCRETDAAYLRPVVQVVQLRLDAVDGFLHVWLS